MYGTAYKSFRAQLTNEKCAKILVIVCLAATLASFRISFYYRDLPNGRTRKPVYPLNNDGDLLYLIWKEHLREMWRALSL